MVNKEICPVCESGILVPYTKRTVITYKDISKSIDGMEHSACSECECIITNSIQSRNNKRRVISFHKEVDGLLTGADIKYLRDKYNITQTKAAIIFGGGPVAFSKYENDEVKQSEAMDKLLRLATDSEDVMSRLALMAGQPISMHESNIIALFKAARERTSHIEFVPNAPVFARVVTKQLFFKTNDSIYNSDEAKSATT